MADAETHADVLAILQTFEEELREKNPGLSPELSDLTGAYGAAKAGDLMAAKRLYDCVEFNIQSCEVENFEK